jgi:Helix-turn-helix domain
MRLAETDLPISLIAFEVGLANLANFNRQFRSVRGITPSGYRKSFQHGGGLHETFDPQELLTRPYSLDHQRKHAKKRS